MKWKYGVKYHTGSILGPTPFRIDINDIARLKLYGQIKMYADDTNVMYYVNDIEQIKADMMQDLATIQE